MLHGKHHLLALALAAFASTSASSQVTPKLSLQGSPYFGGEMGLTLSEPTSGGQFAWAALGLDPAPLHALVPTSSGPWAIGTLLRVVPAGFMPASGRLDVLFNVGPQIPSAIGVHLVVQGYVLERLSNPATLPLDLPYFLAADAQVITSPSPSQAAFFGDRVAIGDLNGDQVPDLIVGAWFEKVGSVTIAGRVYVFWGPDFTTSVQLQSPVPISQGLFGEALGLGDVNGDGQVDLILPESPGASPLPPAARGHLYVYFGGRNFPAVLPGITVASAGSGEDYNSWGRRTTVGDFNGDHLADVAVAVELATVNGMALAGKVEVYWGPALSTTTTLFDPAPAPSSYFADALFAADVTGDGIEDLILGASRKTVGGVFGIGRVYVYAGPALELAHQIENPVPAGQNSRFGNALAAADLDGNGSFDLITTDQRDHVLAFWGPGLESMTVVDRPPSIFAVGEDSTSYGYELGTGDVNGDGWCDIAVTDPFSGTLSGCPSLPGGAVFVALGPYLATHHVLFDVVPTCQDAFGWSVAARDLDGDGRVELLVGDDIADPFGVGGAGKTILFRNP